MARTPKGSQLSRPFAREGQLRAFSGGVGGGSSLAGEGDLGADVHDGAARGLEHRQCIVRHGVVMDQILVEALDEAIRRAGFEANAVVRARIVDEADHAPVSAADVVDGVLALFRIGELRFDEVAFAPAVQHFGEEVFYVVRGAADDDHRRPLVEAGAGDGLADARAAAGDYDHAVVQAEVHGGQDNRVGIEHKKRNVSSRRFTSSHATKAAERPRLRVQTRGWFMLEGRRQPNSPKERGLPMSTPVFSPTDGTTPITLPTQDPCCQSPCDPPWRTGPSCITFTETKTLVLPIVGSPAAGDFGRGTVTITVTYTHTLCLVAKQRGGWPIRSRCCPAKR